MPLDDKSRIEAFLEEYRQLTIKHQIAITTRTSRDFRLEEIEVFDPATGKNTADGYIDHLAGQGLFRHDTEA